MSDRLLTVPADQMSGAAFLDAVLGDPNDITGRPQAGGYYLRDGAWMLIGPEHYTREQLIDVEHGTAPDTGNDRVAA